MDVIAILFVVVVVVSLLSQASNNKGGRVDGGLGRDGRARLCVVLQTSTQVQEEMGQGQRGDRWWKMPGLADPVGFEVLSNRTDV